MTRPSIWAALVTPEVVLVAAFAIGLIMAGCYFLAAWCAASTVVLLAVARSVW